MSDRILRALRYHILACDEAGDFCGCERAGAAALRKALRQEIARRGLARAVKTTIMTCNQPGVRGPVLVVYPDGIWYEGLTVDDVPRFVEEQLIAGRPLEEKLLKRPLVTGHSAY
ncbi:MAG: (2Fe-2S) ferredoxin domain-containing protein [Chloroflexota bacterium]|nr:(2Fe-2S) ferredoxin domain-containing protein [Dehalococcoidia bacterium]MDW8253188.1 (2Fe-2S) ferredoxin domain-containing protein [Chloroflexota bacterium]